ncbi:hypothetical protein H6F75_00370 [Nodosilinea sp. FACHB-131]|uniref:hypothetical protein n=1 Tax=Cyanophyceae TaxID=3028117 RepID=UPI001689BED4|nr:hypothetical protein [Nodosilinea sp. FACHB-131]MBD1871924.1 hypothetical protein [Nodosilinea sp. FACHB-131]
MASSAVRSKAGGKFGGSGNAPTRQRTLTPVRRIDRAELAQRRIAVAGSQASRLGGRNRFIGLGS